MQAGNPSGLNPGDPEPREFTVQEAWTPKYVGLSETDETKAIVGVDAEEGSAAGRWFIKVVPVAEYNAVGSQYTYLNLNARKWASENPVICKDSDTVEIDALAFGDYFIYAIGVNNHGEINYTYAVEAVTITKVLSPYEKFLGTWSFPRGDSADTWTVTENVPDKSYYITGIDGKTEIKVPADFNAADGTIVVKTNTNLGKSTVNTAEGELTGDAQILGKIDYNGTIYRINGNYTIFTVKINADASKADLVPGVEQAARDVQVGRRGVASVGTPQPEGIVANRRRAVRLHPVAAAAVAAQQHVRARDRHLAVGHHHAAIPLVAYQRAAARRGRPVDFALRAGQPHGPVVAVLPRHVDHVRDRGAARDVENAVLVATDHDRVFGGLVVAAAEWSSPPLKCVSPTRRRVAANRS